MNKKILVFLVLFFLIFFIDQFLKNIFVNGFRWDGNYFSLILTYNKGVAFSIFAFLGEWLKFIQLTLITGLLIYFYYEKQIFSDFYPQLGIIFGAGCSNIFDRFIHGGVVDYVFWHKWFEFAVFNFADVMIDIAVVIIIIKIFFGRKTCKEISI